MQDTGTGISEEIRPRLFEPHFSTKSQGMGLGLAICRRVVEDLGGAITTTHAADERIPVEAVHFGVDALYQVLRRYGEE